MADARADDLSPSAASAPSTSAGSPPSPSAASPPSSSVICHLDFAILLGGGPRWTRAGGGGTLRSPIANPAGLTRPARCGGRWELSASVGRPTTADCTLLGAR